MTFTCFATHSEKGLGPNCQKKGMCSARPPASNTVSNLLAPGAILERLGHPNTVFFEMRCRNDSHKFWMTCRSGGLQINDRDTKCHALYATCHTSQLGRDSRKRVLWPPQASSGLAFELGLDEDASDSEEEPEDDEDQPSFADGERNSQLTVGYKGDRTYVVRGNKIGVFTRGSRENGKREGQRRSGGSENDGCDRASIASIILEGVGRSSRGAKTQTKARTLYGRKTETDAAAST
ncbi:hypothetical protein B0H10DRAFT_1948745 [Mycena sp. CBHHK59/15]|nr:hypothetical protein B0H10DRAFT_1948745 [Mycena sp. CBHHK59/15]